MEFYLGELATRPSISKKLTKGYELISPISITILPRQIYTLDMCIIFKHKSYEHLYIEISDKYTNKLMIINTFYKSINNNSLKLQIKNISNNKIYINKHDIICDITNIHDKSNKIHYLNTYSNNLSTIDLSQLNLSNINSNPLPQEFPQNILYPSSEKQVEEVVSVDHKEKVEVEKPVEEVVSVDHEEKVEVEKPVEEVVSVDHEETVEAEKPVEEVVSVDHEETVEVVDTEEEDTEEEVEEEVEEDIVVEETKPKRKYTKKKVN